MTAPMGIVNYSHSGRFGCVRFDFSAPVNKLIKNKLTLHNIIKTYQSSVKGV